MKIKQIVSKRKSCAMCNKKFNKESTLNPSIHKVLKVYKTSLMEGQGPKENKM